MSTELLLGASLLVALIAYALLGGADYGGGMWDLLASGPRRRSQRELIEHAIGPIWETNHVWLILVIVVLLTGFPLAFAALSTTLFIPLTLLLFGVVLRGAAFTFRAHDEARDDVRARWGLAFSISSVFTPLLLGAVVGAIASGRLHVAPDGTPLSAPMAWLSPFTCATGLLTAALFAFLAAVYLTVEATGALREDFRRRALGAGGVVVAAALATGLLGRAAAPVLFAGLTSRPWSVPFFLVTLAVAAGALVAILTRRVLTARVLAAAEVGLLITSWAAGQFPYLVVPDLTLDAAAAPARTQVALLVALALGALTLVPSLWLLFRVFKGAGSGSNVTPTH